ncbi:MAG: hypothetical protein EHM32_11895 [Spirochaetales bacterium]|nr:MAG: hypothetical protein EHM32_11895 [Spirochaetales bacterium]
MRLKPFDGTTADAGEALGESSEIEKSEGPGMKPVRLLTRQMKGEISITGNDGTSFSVRVAPV